MARIFRKTRNFSSHAVRHLAKGDLSGWMARINAQIRRSNFKDALSLSSNPSNQWRFGIMTPPHTELMAQLMQGYLQKHGWQADLLTACPVDWAHDWYIVISPKFFSRLPPEQKRILFLIEDFEALQRYGNKDYKFLRKSFGVLVSSLPNIEYLAGRKIAFPIVHFLPIEEFELGISGAQRFTFMFERFLVAQGFLPVSWVKRMELPISLSTADAHIGLSLPETIERRKIFKTSVPDGYIVFDGIRRQPGWLGCGLSYLTLARHAVKHGNKTLSVMEDDVVLPADFASKIKVVQEFLEARDGQWDVFSGVIAALHPQVEILSVEIYQGVTFVTINRMTSTVFNIYSTRALHILASWDSENSDAETNTIDRYLERHGDLRVVVTLPFLVGHREEVNSTIWESSNNLYSELIKSSEKALISKVSAHQLNESPRLP